MDPEGKTVAEIELNVAPALELEGIPDLGAELEAGGFRARFADQPIACSLADIFESLGKPIPRSLQLYRMFRVWLIPHHVGIIRERGLAEVISVGIEVRYQTNEETCSVVSLFPSTEYTELGGVSFNGRLSAFISPTGDIAKAVEFLAGMVDQDGHTASSSPAATPQSAEFLGMRFESSVGGSLSLNVSATVVTPKVAAIGRGTAHPQWQFELHDMPLHGRDLQAWSLVVLPKHRKELNFDARFFVVYRSLFVPVRRLCDWQAIRCDLKNSR